MLEYFGLVDEQYLGRIVDAWMSDGDNSRHRFDTIKAYLPNAKTILDIASGCGTCVYYGLLNGYDMYGVEPERWKNKFNAMKAAEYRYPSEWQDRFFLGMGENLPFKDDSFDCVTTYQTLEHVQSPKRTLSEMLRVTRPSGGVHIQCPDYRSTFEAHYLLPWLPFFPRSLANVYLRIMKRPVRGLESLQYVSLPRLVKYLKRIASDRRWKIEIIDVDKKAFEDLLFQHSLPNMPGGYFAYTALKSIKNLFRLERNVNLFVRVVAK